MFNEAELLAFIDQATWVVVNDYESKLLQERTELSAGEIADRVEGLIVTRGARGSVIYTRDGRVEVPVVKAQTVADPTGCGDAYRAGLLYSLMNDFDWKTTGRVASLLGSLKVGSHGTQNHRFEVQEFHDRFVEAFGYSF
jgi:adenosine kinase